MPVQWVLPSLDEERLGLHRTVRSLQLQVGQVSDACRRGDLVELTEDTWVNVQDSESLDITTLAKFIEVGKIYNWGIERLLVAFRRRKEVVCLPAPILLDRSGSHGGSFLTQGDRSGAGCPSFHVFQ